MTALSPVTSLTHEPSTAATVDVERGAASWRALGTYVELRTTPEAVEAAADLAARVLDEVDVACSRFRDDSDLMRANRDAGHAVEVSPVLVGAVRVALEAADETDGLVDPLLGDVLRAAGLRPHLLARPRRRPDPRPPCRCPRPRWAQVEVDRHHRDRAPWRGPRPRRDRQGLRRRPRRPLRRRHAAAHPCWSRVGGDVRVAAPRDDRQDQPVVVGHSLADLEAGGAEHPGAARRRRARHLQRLGAAVAPRRPPVAPRRRPAHRPSRPGPVAHRHRPGPHRCRGERRHHCLHRARRRRVRHGSSTARSPLGSSTTTAT